MGSATWIAPSCSIIYGLTLSKSLTSRSILIVSLIVFITLPLPLIGYYLSDLLSLLQNLPVSSTQTPKATFNQLFYTISLIPSLLILILSSIFAHIAQRSHLGYTDHTLVAAQRSVPYNIFDLTVVWLNFLYNLSCTTPVSNISKKEVIFVCQKYKQNLIYVTQLIVIVLKIPFNWTSF